MSAHPPPGGILALDLSSIVGYAYGPIEWARPISGRWLLKVKGELEADRYCRVGRTAYEEIARLRPAKVILEAPLPVFAMNSESSARQQYGLRGCVMAEVSAHGMNPEEISADLVRAALLGRTHFPKGTVKGHVMAWARAQGLNPIDDNEADAIALWAYYAGQLRRGMGLTPAMLMRPEQAGLL